MNQEQKFSDEFLNAFVDDQLASEEKGRAYLSINSDESLNRQVCELRKMRDLVQLAYKDLPAVTAPGPRAGRLGANIAAGFVLALGVGLGWLLHQPGTSPELAPPIAALPTTVSAPPARETQKSPAVSPAKPAVVAVNEVKVLFHLNSDKPERIQEVWTRPSSCSSTIAPTARSRACKSSSTARVSTCCAPIPRPIPSG